MGRDYAHHGTIFPFFDNPTFGVRVLFYPVAMTPPYVPFPSPFVLRNWDRLEQLPQTQLGTDQSDNEPYFGPLPNNPPGRPCGSADQWLNGCSYAVWIAGGYSCDCPGDTLPAYVQQVTCDDGSIHVAPTTGNVVVHIDVTHTNVWTAEQHFQALVKLDFSALVDYVGLQVFGTPAIAPSLIFQVVSNGEVNFAAEVVMISKRVVRPAGVTILRDHLGVGLDIGNDALGAPSQPFLRCIKGGPTVQFAIGKDGQLWTNQSVALVASGSPIFRMPIYDASGTLIGYIPIYDTNP